MNKEQYIYITTYRIGDGMKFLQKAYKCLKILEYKSVCTLIHQQHYFLDILITIIAICCCNNTDSWSKHAYIFLS